MATPELRPENQVERLEKLEREYRNLAARLHRLERGWGSCLAGLLGNAILLVAAALVLDYMGLLPAAVERLPLDAKSVAANEFVLRESQGRRWGMIHVSRNQAVLTRYGEDGRPAKEEPILPAH